MYTLNAEQLKPIYDWVKNYERFWTGHLERIKAVAEAKARQTPLQRSDSHG